ncbi:MAG: tetratricopeptide repeat protein [Spirochaetes bacterium]|nr:tetratricopeptide repeat protein [Spirochaetota bacterium]
MINRKLKTFLRFAAVLSASVFTAPAWSADMISRAEDVNTRIFYTEDDKMGWDAVVKGKVLSFSTRLENEKNDLSESVHDRSQVTVRLYDNLGVKIGDSLFVINSRNLIVSRIKVSSIFKSNTFGYLLVGNGNFLLANEGDRVTQRVEGESSRFAFIYKSRGEYFEEVGEAGNAINNYKKAIELDRGNPEAHLALGYVYMRDRLYQFAITEFSEAYKQITRLYDREDKFSLLIGMAEVRFREAYYENLTDTLRQKYINEGIKYSKEALGIYPDSKNANYLLAVFYYKNADTWIRIILMHILRCLIYIKITGTKKNPGSMQTSR